MRLTKIIEFRIIAMADHYDQKCHVLILFKNKIIKKGWVFTQLESTIISLENGFSTHVSTHLSRRPVLQAAFDRVIKICRFTDVGEVLYTKFCFFSPGMNFYVLITGWSILAAHSPTVWPIYVRVVIRLARSGPSSGCAQSLRAGWPWPRPRRRTWPVSVRTWAWMTSRTMVPWCYWHS